MAQASLRRARLLLTGSRAWSTWEQLGPGMTARWMSAGQPIHETHPQVFGAGELLPGILADEFAQRRRNLADLLPAGAVAIVPAAAQSYVTGVIPYPYRQDADFLYLTGIAQQAHMVIQCPQSGGDPSFTLFVSPKSAERERWDGVPLRPDIARGVFGADEVYTTAEMAGVMKGMISSAQSLYFNPESYGGRFHHEVPALREAVASGGVKHLKPYLHKLRWTKSESELHLMRASAHLAATTIKKCMGLTKEAHHESFLAATFEYDCRLGGASRVSYPPVVAGGPDACTVHYIRNDKMLERGKLVLMDAGCEYWGYASDVTRTWPVGGKFSNAQREVYDAVLNVHRQCLDACRTGSTLRQVHSLSVRLTCEAIARLGLLGTSDPATVMSGGGYRPLYCHSVGHWLGIDTHDTNTVSHDLPLQPGVVMTIEPGLYIPDDPKYGKYAGIGVRIEDDVFISPGGLPAEVLSSAVPTDPEEIEDIIRSGSS